MKKFLLPTVLLVASITQAFAGVASWYGPGFHGKRTANGETYNMHAMTAAHKTLTFGTKVKVTNLRNGKSTVVCINDRGPYAHGRVIDLSKKANQKLNCNLCKVKLEVIHKPKTWRYGKKVCT
ncbi:septal ring lytic transglycosylase RlpA family protein [Psychrobacter sp. HD31]|uniref:septal ring lytic transglycosylase RlpA family protein n=1 Tax=Psychrobacter sp. HD31 TaxID=3112003 RepID=UPI003DA53CD1